MFTGLIEAIGFIATIVPASGGKRITVSLPGVSANRFLENITLGDSIAVDGACMTVVAFDESGFSFEASPESLSLTTLGQCQPGQPGSRVNLERPLTPSSRIGGHYVTGHVDGLAQIVSREEEGNSIVFQFKVQADELAELLVPKGSVAILGISLTVNRVNGTLFSVAIIPHTLSHTTLGDYQPGDWVNIETDLLGKYVRRLLPGNRAEQPGQENDLPSRHDGPEPILDVPALRHASDAIRSTQAFSPSQIRTGGWFNFTENESE